MTKAARVTTIRPTKAHKANLILVQSYPANSSLSSGVIRYFEDFFNVYFVDLPGFHPSVRPLDKVAINGYVKYLQEYVDELDLDEFMIAGMSFGFLVVNKLKLDEKKCVAVIGLAPFLGYEYLRFSKFKRFAFLVTLALIDRVGIAPKIWNTNFARLITMKFLGGKSEEVINTIMTDIDAETMVKTGYLLLKEKNHISFNERIPHVLFMNPHDAAVNFCKTLDTFFSKLDANAFRVIVTNIEHYPKNPTYKYFKKAITQNEIESLFNFVDFCQRN